MMASILAALALISFYLMLPVDSAMVTKGKQSYEIQDVNIVNVVDGSVQENMTVMIDDGIITQITPTSIVSQSENIIDGKGKYLMPGLWDMHTHSIKLSPQIHHPLYIANGVTGVRDLSGCMIEDDSFWACADDRRRWSDEATKGLRTSPRYVQQSSYQVNGGSEVPADYPSFFKLNKAEDAKHMVEFYESNHADMIKVHAGITAEQYHMLATALKDSDLDLVGHKPLNVSLEQAFSAGQKSLEHGRVFLFECYLDSESFRLSDDPYKAYTPDLQRKLINQQDKEKCDGLMKDMAAADSYWVPTLTTLQSSAYAQDETLIEQPKYDYIPYLMKTLFWQPDLNNAKTKGFDSEGQYIHEDFLQAAKQHIKTANELGVKFLVGTDTLDTTVVAGVSMHDEMASMVDAGLSPAEVLYAATLSAATYAGQQDKFGSVETGKVADLILLDKNPLVNIQHTKTINSVLFNGHLYDEAAIDELNDFAKDQASSVKVNAHYLWSLVQSPLMRMQIAD